jgi:hypothetical protein
MKVLNLRCASEHGFEGWFGSEDDFQSQLGRGLVECPICGDRQITRLPSAPRLNTSGAREPAAPAAQVTTQQLWMRAVQHVIENTEDVGERFPEEARRIHYGEVAQRGIRGRASSEEAQALRDEGIEVAALPLPAAVKGPVQ